MQVDCIWNNKNTSIPINNNYNHYPIACQSNLDEDDDNILTAFEDYEDNNNVVTAFNNDDKPELTSFITSLDSFSDNHEIFHFDSDSIDFYLDTCVTNVLTGFKDDFLPNTFQEENLGSPSTSNGLSSISGHSIACFRMTDDYGRPYDMKTPMNYSEYFKFCLISPQWIKKCKRAQGVPSDKLTHIEFEEDYYILKFENRTKSKKIQHHLMQLVPVLQLNKGIIKYSWFHSEFCYII